jgi:hypothetical protein
MAIQDDIMAMLSQVSDAGDRATSREAVGRKLYAEMGDKLSGDTLYNALRDVESARGPMGEMEDYSRVADILEKYMDDAGDGAPAAVPDDMIVDDTRAAEQVLISSDTAGAIPRPKPEVPMVRREPPALPPDFDPDTAERLILEQDEGLAGLMSGQMAPIRSSDIEPMAKYNPKTLRSQEKFINNILMRFNAGEISERQARQMLQRVSPAALAELEKSGGMMAPASRPFVAPTLLPARMAGGMSVRDRMLKTYGGM